MVARLGGAEFLIQSDVQHAGQSELLGRRVSLLISEPFLLADALRWSLQILSEMVPVE